MVRERGGASLTVSVPAGTHTTGCGGALMSRDEGTDTVWSILTLQKWHMKIFHHSPFYLDECLAMLEVWPSYASQLQHIWSRMMWSHHLLSVTFQRRARSDSRAHLSDCTEFRNTKLIMLKYFCLPCTVWLFFLLWTERDSFIRGGECGLARRESPPSTIHRSN